jgi:hypothetical protein
MLPADAVREVAARHSVERHVARLETIAGELRARVPPGRASDRR